MNASACCVLLYNGLLHRSLAESVGTDNRLARRHTTLVIHLESEVDVIADRSQRYSVVHLRFKIDDSTVTVISTRTCVNHSKKQFRFLWIGKVRFFARFVCEDKIAFAHIVKIEHTSLASQRLFEFLHLVGGRS